MSVFGEGEFGYGAFGSDTPPSFAVAILEALDPMRYPGAEALDTYLIGLSRPFELIEYYASDTDTDIGWSLLLSLDRCPVEALPWLAQIVGVKLPQNLNESEQRNYIAQVSNWRRGTLGAIAGAANPTLTGDRTVIIRERYDGSGIDAPYYMEVVTYSAETPNPAATEAAIRSQKPAGIILTYTVLAGQDFQHVKDTYATLQDVKDRYTDFASMKADL
jgi:hypothetical protein